MNLNDLLTAISQLRTIAVATTQDASNLQGILHTLGQLSEAVRAQLAGQVVRLESVFQIAITSGNDAVRSMKRVLDVTLPESGSGIELKAGEKLYDILYNFFVRKSQAINTIISNSIGGLLTDVKFSELRFTPDTVTQIMARMQELVNKELKAGLSVMVLKEGIERTTFVDAAGLAFRTMLNEKGEIILEPAMDALFGTKGAVATTALDKATHSPDFGPAMEALFGASGKIADAAKDAATGANLDPALQPFEQKVEDGVKMALDQAGDDAKAHAASALASKVGEGARALGDIFTSIPQMYDSVKQLGEVWNQPLNSVDSYMKLFGALGNTINQGVQTIQALAGVTKIASAAQAIFNAIMAMNPVVLIVLAVIALIAVIALLIVYWDQVKAALRDNPWLAVAAVMFGLIGIIVVIIAYWDEIKLAVLIAANFISIQVQKIGLFFVGLGTLIGMVWDYITATAANVGISIINFFITAGTEIQNFFIGLINFVLEAYNAIADSVIGDILGLEKAELIPEVAVESRLIPPKDVPTIDVEAAFKPMDNVTGGLEGAIAEQRGVVAAGQQADADRRAKEAAAAQQPPAPPAGAPAGLPSLPPGAPAAGPGGLPPRPVLPDGAGAGLPGGGGGGVRVEGGIVININAERMELDAAEVLTEEIVSQLKAKLDAMQTAADFRTGVRTA